MKNYKTLLFLSVVLFLGSTFSSCNKYDEGPGFSLASAKSRLSRDWTLINLTEDGENQNIQGYTQFISFEKSGSYTQTVTAQTVWGPATAQENGSWTFSADKKFVNLTKENESTSRSYRLLELRKTQFKVQYKENDKEITRTFKAK